MQQPIQASRKYASAAVGGHIITNKAQIGAPCNEAKRLNPSIIRRVSLLQELTHRLRNKLAITMESSGEQADLITQPPSTRNY
jgi:hypothetical protein